MKVEVVRYRPNFIDADDDIKILEFHNPFDLDHASSYIMSNIPYLKDKIGKLRFKFNTLTQSMITYKNDNGCERPIAFVNLLEL